MCQQGFIERAREYIVRQLTPEAMRKAEKEMCDKCMRRNFCCSACGLPDEVELLIWAKEREYALANKRLHERKVATA